MSSKKKSELEKWGTKILNITKNIKEHKEKANDLEEERHNLINKADDDEEFFIITDDENDDENETTIKPTVRNNEIGFEFGCQFINIKNIIEAIDFIIPYIWTKDDLEKRINDKNYFKNPFNSKEE